MRRTSAEERPPLNSVNGKRKVAASPARNGRTSVVLAESDVPTRLGIRMALESAGFRVAAEVDSADAVVDEVAGAEVCLISVDLPGGGIRAAAAIVAEHPDTAVIMLTGAAEDDELVDAVRVGAVGYIVTNVASTRLPEAINAVLRGEVAIPRLLVSVLADRLRERLGRRQLALRDRPGVELTTREWEVLDFMCDGLSTREIAGRLLISEITVRRHISAVMKKLHVASRREAVKLLASA
jgi:DNA-binding NarL/FixJ family response regulator